MLCLLLSEMELECRSNLLIGVSVTKQTNKQTKPSKFKRQEQLRVKGGSIAYL